MTGFGSGRATVGAEEVTVELRSVNHKFCEVKVRLPRELSALETAVTRTVKERLSRGAIDVSVKRGARAGGQLVPTVDRALAQEYRRAFHETAQALGLPDETTVRDVLQQPGVLRLEEPQVQSEDATAALEQALALALEGISGMRAREGIAIVADLESRLELVGASVREVRQLSPRSVAEYRTRLEERLAELLRGTAVVDPQRLAQEVALFAERIDVAEEVTRLDSHVAQFRALLAGHEPAGRKLDFLVQEMHREVNTTGSKSQAAAITNHIVQLKAELERIREQVQNIE
jgi:uncharacterized protein (TIGR00255 family)